MAEPTNEQTTQLATRQIPNEVIRMGMDTVQGFEALQRCANLLSSSTIVPETYRRWKVDKDGERLGENPSGLANCVVALNMASRMGADVIMITQNMHVIEGRPSWSSIFIIASINQCGKFSPLRFDITPAGAEVEAEYNYVQWEDVNGKRRPVDKVGKIKVKHQTCRAWATEKATGERLEGPEVSIQLALDEGWIQRKGSKWRTMPEVMLRYRAASLFGKLYAPELLMGLQSREEIEDIITIDASTGEVIQEPRGRARVVNAGSSSLAPGMPKALGDWTVEQLDELEGLIEEASTVMRAAGFVKEAGEFEASSRAKRMKTAPDALLGELRAAVSELTKPIDVQPEPKAETSSTPANADGSLIADPDAKAPVVGKARTTK